MLTEEQSKEQVFDAEATYWQGMLWQQDWIIETRLDDSLADEVMAQTLVYDWREKAALISARPDATAQQLRAAALHEVLELVMWPIRRDLQMAFAGTETFDDIEQIIHKVIESVETAMLVLCRETGRWVNETPSRPN